MGGFLFGFVLMGSLVAHSHLLAQTSPRFRINAEEVVLHVLFTDRVGKAIPDMRRGEVKIFEDGAEQEIKRFFRSEKPFEVSLLLDSSVSTRGNMTGITGHSADFVDHLPGEMPVLVISFDDAVYVDCDWSIDRSQLEQAILQIETNEDADRTILYEAVTVVAEQKFSPQTLRKAMVVYSDGINDSVLGLGTSRKESLEVIEESGILVYSIHYDSRDHYRRLYNPISPSPTYPDPPVGTTGKKLGPIFVGGGPLDGRRDQAEYRAQMIYEAGKRYLMELAKRSGGRFFETLTMSALSDTYAKIVAELSTVYTITYLPPRRERDRQFHRINVRTTREGVAVRPTREGYWAR